MPMAGSNATSQAVATGNNNNASTPTAGAGGGGPVNNNAAVPAVGTAKTWELSDYELHRTPQEAVTDGSEIAVSPRALHSELMCPICLDMLHNTMTTKECLHRFCSECIITALRSGNKECPTCRKKLVSKRSLRHDPNFDQLIAKIYPSRDEYEAQQQKAMARLSKSHNQLALASSIEEGMKAQSQQRKPKIPGKGGVGTNNGDGDGLTGLDSNGEVNMSGNPLNPTETDGTTNGGGMNPASHTLSNTSAGHLNPLGNIVPGGSSSGPPTSIGLGLGLSATIPMMIGAGIGLGLTPTSSNPSHLVPSPAKVSRTDSIGGDSSNTSGYSEEVTEVELVFKPHPDMIPANSATQTAQNQTRYIKTTANAWVEHLAKYLAMRLALDLDSQSEAASASNLHNCTIYVSPTGGSFITIPQNQTLAQVCEKYWRFNKPLEMYYSWKKI